MALSYSSYLDQRGACPGPAGTDGVTGATGPKGDPGSDAGLKYYFIAESTGPSGPTWPQPAINEVRYYMAKRGPNIITAQNPLQVNHRGYYTWINGSGPTGPTTGGYVTNLLGEFSTNGGDPGLSSVEASVWNFSLFLYSWILVAPGASGATIGGVRVFVEVYKHENSGDTLLATSAGNPVSINKVIGDDTPYTFDLVVGTHSFSSPTTDYYIFKFFAYTTASGGYTTNQQVEFWTEGDFLSKTVTGIPNANGNTGATGPVGNTGPSGPSVDPTTSSGAILYWNATRTVGDSNLIYIPSRGSVNFGQNGTATGPVITWTGDADTGIWHPAENTLALSTNATEKLRIDATGAIIITNNGTATGPSIVWSGDLGAGIWHPTTNTLAISTSSAERLRLDSSGNIGIGTGPTGAAKLDVGGRTRLLVDGSTSTSQWGLNNSTDTLIVQHSGNYSTVGDLNKAGSILFANGTLNYPQARIASQMTAVTPSTYSSNLIFQTNGGGSSLTERMRINTDGAVGIGTSTPGYTLDVSGNFRATNSTTVQGIGTGTGYVVSSITGGGSYGGIDMNGYFIQYVGGTSASESNKLIQFPSDTGQTNYFMTNKVGIGTKTASYSLDVVAPSGTAAINVNTWPRYPISNICILKNGTGYVGNTINWASSVQSISSSLATVTHTDATFGCSFVINKAGIWSISYALNSLTSGAFTWVDISSTNASNVAFNTAGNHPLSNLAQTSTGWVQYNWTGYLPANSNFYKVRLSASPTTANNPMYFYLTYHGELDTNLSFPY